MSQRQLFKEEAPKVGEIEESLRSRGIESVIGVDEAGRGPLAGPVHAAACWMDLGAPMPKELDRLDDSKKLTEPIRESLFEGLHRSGTPIAVGISDATVIDEINILQATFRAMASAVAEVIATAGKEPDLVLVDGNMIIPGQRWAQQSVVKGDARSLAIAAASILAKVSRDRVMHKAHQRWPQYGFASNKGYGTAAHRKAIEDHGPCPLHRRSFAGVVQNKAG